MAAPAGKAAFPSDIKRDQIQTFVISPPASPPRRSQGMRVVSGGAGDAAGCRLSSDTCFPFGQFLVRRFDVQLGRGELLVINLAPSSSPTCELALISLLRFHRLQMLAGVSGFRAAPPGHVASPRRAKRGWHLKHGDSFLNTGQHTTRSGQRGGGWLRQSHASTSLGAASSFPPVLAAIFRVVGTHACMRPFLQVVFPSPSPNTAHAAAELGSGPRPFIVSKVIRSAAGLKSRIAFLSLFMSTRYTLLAFFSFGSVFCAVLRERSEAIFYLLQNSK